MEVFWLPIALENLKEIERYILQNDPGSVKKVAQKIKNTVLLIKEHSFIGKPSLVDGFREIKVANLPFVIPYKVVENKIIIVRIFHTRQKPINWNK